MASGTLLRARTSTAAVAAVLALLLLAGDAAGAPRSADNWQDADHLAPSTVFVTDNSAATIQNGEPLTSSGSSVCSQKTAGTWMDRTKWWYVLGTGGRIVVSTRASSMDSVLAVHPPNANPAPGAFLFCSDDVNGTDDGQITLDDTVAGARYLVQAGSCDGYWNDAQHSAWTACPDVGGELRISAVTNDQRTHPDTTGSGDRANVGAGVDPGEVTSCNGAAYGSTVWFRHRIDKPGWLTVVAARFDMVLSIYKGGGTQPEACADGDAALSERLRHYVTPGDYYVQVGGKLFGGVPAQDNFAYETTFQEDPDVDKDGSPRPDDCDDSNAGIRPGKPDVAHNGVDEDCSGGDNKDGDGDGHAARFAGGDDCDDTKGHVHPGVADKPNNGVDEDCDGADAPDRVREPQVAFPNRPYLKGRVFGNLTLRGLRKGYRVEIRCRRSSECPRRFRTKARRSKLVFKKFRRKYFRSGSTVEIRVVQRGNVIGFYKRYVVRGRKKPKQRICELDPAKRKPVRCS